jgi:AraC family transcriptional regulator
VTRGAYLSTARGAPAICDPPTLVYNPPGTTHRDRFLSDAGLFVTISVARTTLGEVREAASIPDHALFLGPEAVGSASRLCSLAWERDGAGALAVESLCLELLGRVGRTAGLARRPPPPWLERGRELLHDRCAEDLSVAAIAAALGVHPIHLTRAFRLHFRMTPGDYLRRCRLEKAAALLAGTFTPLAEVALASGFCDQSHLTRAFRRSYRTTPGAYREARPARRRP